MATAVTLLFAAVLFTVVVVMIQEILNVEE